MNSNNYKVRFHLAAGKNFMKWQVSDMIGNVDYYDPKEVTLVLTHCTLRNQPGGASKIHKGGRKTVVAWIDCGKVSIESKDESVQYKDKVSYNPRIEPYWRLDNGLNVDKNSYLQLKTLDKQVYINLNN